MADEKKDNWSTEEYQHSAAFVPKLATKVVQWLDVQKDDVILDIGCGDGVLNIEFAKVLSQGQGAVHGIDASPSMISAAARAAEAAPGGDRCTFEVVDANEMDLDRSRFPFRYTKAFSNAAMHWILKPDTASTFFARVREVLPSGATFAFEMGGLGNVSEMRTALVLAAGRVIGLDKAKAADPWFFPDEKWLARTMEEEAGGWKIDKVEREWRPTAAGEGGVEGWVRLMGKAFLDAVEKEKGADAVEGVPTVAGCSDPTGGLAILSRRPILSACSSDLKLFSNVICRPSFFRHRHRHSHRYDTKTTTTDNGNASNRSSATTYKMSADDQQFLDVLSSLPNHIRRYSDDIANQINSQVDKAAEVVRDTLSSAQWIPDSVRPTPVSRSVPIEIIAVTRYEQVRDWISRNKLVTGAAVAVFGVVVYKTYRSSSLYRKTRRAKRARNGGRLEVVVIAGSPTLPLTRSLSLDMERRGFIVFVVCNAVEDESMVHNMSRPDIKPLTIDATDPPSAGNAIERFAQYLQSPHAPAPRTKPNFLELKSVILIPSLNYQTSPIATIPPSSFADLFNTHLLHPILTIQAFLPLLTARLSPAGEKWHPPKVMVFTPSIISSINPPFHAPEATVCSALSAFTEVLTAELRPLGVPVTHMQLGTFDFAGFTPAKPSHTSAYQKGLIEGPGIDADAAETLMWPENARHAYGRNFVTQSTSAISAGRIRGLKGSSLRHLHNAVFDVVDGSITSGTVRVGLGAGVYGFVGRWVPRGIVAFMMGIRRVDELSAWQTSSYDGSREGSENGDNQDFIAVPGDGESNVWRRS
ncbi:hypothetical protein VD0001_g1790 [Verticillium dahliae]|nr:Transcriptional regulatory protein moc3 [Verticillium dahliae VDG2]PNH75816.1 hypothetical protein VD0001_g1790 [Verticillium dahliae]